MMKSDTASSAAVSRQDLNEIEQLTPFTRKELQGKRFRSGNMLGGAMPLQSEASSETETSPENT